MRGTPNADGAGRGIRPRIAYALLVVGAIAILAWLFTNSAPPERSEGPGADLAASADPTPQLEPGAASGLSGAAPQRAPAAEPVESGAAAAAAAAPGPSAGVHGYLLDSAREPIRDAWYAVVSLTDAGGHRHHTQAGPDGAYSFTALEFGEFWVQAAADGYQTLEERFELRPEEPNLRRDLVLPSAVVLRIRLVTPEGTNTLDALRAAEAPYSALTLFPVATLQPPGERLLEVMGSRNEQFGVGNFWDYGPRIEALPPGYLGVLFLTVQPPVWVSLLHNQAVLQTQQVLPGQEEVVFVLDPDEVLAGLAEVRVQLIEAETGLPIPHADVSFTGGSGGGEMVASDLDGSASFEDLEPGQYQLQVHADGYAHWRAVLDLAPGTSADLGSVALEPELLVEGRVLDHEGQPRAASITLAELGDPSGELRWFGDVEFRSGKDGSFRLHGLGRREYAIRTHHHDAGSGGDPTAAAWASGVQIFDARAAAAAGLILRVRPTARLLLRPPPERAVGLRFRVLDERGLALASSRFHGPGSRPFYLPEGQYRVQLLDAAGQLLLERSTTLGRESLTLELSE